MGISQGRRGGRGQQPLRVGECPEPAEKRYCTCALRTGVEDLENQASWNVGLVWEGMKNTKELLSKRHMTLGGLT